MRRLAANDATALDEILREHWLAIVAYAAAIVLSREVGEDIAQETVLRLWRQRESWEPVAPLRTFLLRIARNLALNEKDRGAVRGRGAERVELGWTRPPTPLEELEQKELRVAVEAAVARLPARRREVFILARVHGLSYQEIAAVMGISLQTVANQMSAALTDLRHALARFSA
jgi:RNA polymerase sigma-70 factor (ECF subfamily)